MFKRTYFSACALIALTALATYWLTIRLCSGDIPTYHLLMQQSTELRTRRALEEQPAHQNRQGVQKDIWTQQENRHLQIESGRSELTLSQKRDKIEAVEELKEIHCTMGAETLSADEGMYLFPSHQFIAQNRCKLTQGESYIEGTRIQFDFSEEVVIYDNPQGFFTKGPLHFTAQSLIWDKKEGKLHLTEQVTLARPGEFTLEADSGLLTLQEFDPQLLILTGNVRLISSRIQGKESHAIAETLTYHPEQKTLLFSSPKKVLFWQQGLSLSASEVLIRADESVEGKGDVHFAFDVEEQNYIDELFKQYL